MRKPYLLTLALGLITACSIAQNPHLDSLKQALALEKDDARRFLLLDSITHNFTLLPPAEFLAYAQEMVPLARRLDHTKLAKASYLLMVSYYQTGNMEKAVAAGQETLSLIDERSGDPEERMIAHNTIGQVYKEMGKNKECLDHLFQSLAIAEKYRNERQTASALASIGVVYHDLQEPQKGRDYEHRALEIFLHIPDSLYAAVMWNNLSESEVNPDTALGYARAALAIFDRQSYVDGVAQAANNVGRLLLLQKQYSAALPYLERARAIFEPAGFHAGLLDTYKHLGLVHGGLNDLGKADAFFQQAITESKQVGGKAQLAGLYEALSRFYESKDQTGPALRYLRLAGVLRDSAFSETHAKELADAATRYQTEVKERELRENELVIANQRTAQRNLLIGALVLLLLVGSFFQYLRNRQSIKQKEAELALQLEQLEAGKLRDLDRLKSNFFANISHEFRTPLTLIVGPLREMLAGTFRGDVQKYNRIMLRNSERLLQLVNQLLDLLRLESGRLELQVAEGDAGRFLRAIVFSFESVAERKQIDFQVDIPTAPLPAWFDRDKLEKIITNLLSNAFKFTPEEGRVSVTVKYVPTGLHLAVTNTGAGIPAEHLPHIFERFFSAPSGGDGMEGSGIGLALTKDLVALHKGTIEVQSVKNQETVFIVTLPIHQAAFRAEDLVTLPTEATAAIMAAPAAMAKGDHPVIAQKPKANDVPLILVVEDNADVRRYIIDQLGHEYRLLEADNGRIGLDLAFEHTPDLVLTDIMMPEIDGLELTRQLKADPRTSHIPVIALTAKAERADKLEGLSLGADDYLTKPFDGEELRLRLHNQLAQQRKMRERYARHFSLHPTETAVTSVDEQFLQKTKTLIEEHLDDEQFSVTELADGLALSRSQLHRKLQALIGQGPNEVIREMRLLRAKELLEKGAGNASEVAYMVGFSSLAYFSKRFSERFGVSPGVVKK